MVVKTLIVCLAILGLCTACTKKVPRGGVERIPKTQADEYYQNYYETPPLK